MQVSVQELALTKLGFDPLRCLLPRTQRQLYIFYAPMYKEMSLYQSQRSVFILEDNTWENPIPNHILQQQVTPKLVS